MMADQSVRNLGSEESIPSPSTADLLLQDVPPLRDWPVSGSGYMYFSAQNRGSKKSAQNSIQQRHERFAPHIQTITEMKSAGATYDAIGKKVGKTGEAIRKYYNKYREKFKEKQ